MRFASAASAALLVAACAPGLRAPVPVPGPDPAVGDPAAALLRMEDRREYDAALLGAAAASADPAVRRRAALAAGRLRDPRALPLLGRLLADGDTAVAATAAFALGQVGDTAAVPFLLPHLEAARLGAAPTVTSEAAYALGKLRSEAAKAALTRLVADAAPDAPGTRGAVGSALRAMPRHPRPLPVEAIARWLEGGDAELRARAAYALSRRPEPAATAALFPYAADPDAAVRGYVARSLGALTADSAGVGRAAALERLMAMAAADPDREVRINAIRTLGTHPGEATVSLLARTAAGDEPYLAVVAMESLQRLGREAGAAASVLEGIALDEARQVFLRQTALGALAALDPGAAVRVAEVLDRSPEWRLRAAAARAFVQGGEGGMQRAMLAVREPDGRVAAAALDQALATLGDSAPEARMLVMDALAHPDAVVRAGALAPMARTGETGFLPLAFDAYERARRDTLNDAALAAVDAIAAMAAARAGTWDAFFTVFPRPDDYLVRQRVAAALGDSLPNPWGDPLPIETGMEPEEYAAVADAAARRPLRRAVIETSRGDIRVELFQGDAPLTVRSFLELAAAGFFDGQEWPRVVPNFVIQGGDPRGDTSGGPGYSIRDEINRHRYRRGTLGMALSGPDTGGSQWFLTHSPQPHLDGTYTVFGRVLGGWEALDAILPGDRIIRIREVP